MLGPGSAPPPASPAPPSPAPVGAPPSPRAAASAASGAGATLAAPRPTGENGDSRKRALVLVGIAAVTALVVGGAVYAVSRGGGEGEDVATATTQESGTATSAKGASETTAASEQAEPARLPSDQGMAAVPAGSYPLGSATPGAEAAPARKVDLDPFHLDAFEITNQQYQAFVQDQGAPAPSSWRGGRMPEDKATHPVVGVEFGWAQAYCISLSKRLPTEAEWEAAARGPQGSLYPWGNDPKAVNLDIAGSTPVGSVAGNVEPVGRARPGRLGVGVG